MNWAGVMVLASIDACMVVAHTGGLGVAGVAVDDTLGIPVVVNNQAPAHTHRLTHVYGPMSTDLCRRIYVYRHPFTDATLRRRCA